MSSKSMSGMFLANHSSMGLRSKRLSALSRNFVIHSGSDFPHEMSWTTSSFKPFFGSFTYDWVSCQPSLYLPRSMPETATGLRLLDPDDSGPAGEIGLTSRELTLRR